MLLLYQCYCRIQNSSPVATHNHLQFASRKCEQRMEQGTNYLSHNLLKTATSLVLLSVIVLAPCIDAAQSEDIPTHSQRRLRPWSARAQATSYGEQQDGHGRKLATLVPSQPLVLPYHNGPILSGRNNVTKLYLIFYGKFTKLQRFTVRRFLRSMAPPRHRARASIPTVAKWWEITKGYVDVYGESVAQQLIPSGEVQDETYSRGTQLNQTDVEALLMNALPTTFDVSARSLYIVVTASDVEVAGFCQESCGQHAYLYPSDVTGGQMLPYVWVGDASTQCPGLCCWPFANVNYTFMQNMPEPLLPPSGDIGADGLVINLATLIAGAATNPYQNAYYQGDAGSPLEAAEACRGIFGNGAYAGYPGELMRDNATGASFNSFGFRGDKFLVPWMWSPSTYACAGQNYLTSTQ